MVMATSYISKPKSHLFYADYLKLYGTNDNRLNGLVNIVKVVSIDIMMEFSLGKCTMVTFKRGKKILKEPNCTGAMSYMNLSQEQHTQTFA